MLKQLIFGLLVALFGTLAVLPALLLGWFVTTSAADVTAAATFRVLLAADLVILGTIALSLLFAIAISVSIDTRSDGRE